MQQDKAQNKWHLQKPRETTSLERFAEKYSSVFNKLTDDEKELLAHLAMELTDEAIVKQLGISLDSLRDCRVRLRNKLSIQSSADYIKYALAFGLIPF